MDDPDGLVLESYRPDGRLTVEYRLRGRRVANKGLRVLLIDLIQSRTGLAGLSEGERAELAARIAYELRDLIDSVAVSRDRS